MFAIQRLALGAVLLGAASVVSGCYAEADPVPVYTTSGVVTSDDYEPAYYDGYLVYYDDLGHPYYYDNGGAVIWISPGSPYYVGLVNHWHVYGPAYHRWYAHYGYRYHGYRSHAGHYYYHGYHSGGGHRGGGHHR